MSRPSQLAVLLAAILLPASLAAAIDPASPQWSRALKGMVVGPDGKPIAGAEVKCAHVRTPGDGLISSVGQPVQTDAQGRFAIYPQDAEKAPFDGPAAHGDFTAPRPREHGDLVPLNSKYHVQVDVPADEAFFPHEADYSNTDVVTIRLQRPEKRRTFKYESPDGGFMTETQLQALYQYYKASPRAENNHLPPRYRNGGHLAPGTYTAQLDRISFETITVTRESPDVLVFRLPPPVTYRGRVVDVASGAPLAGVFVLGLESTGDRSLAYLEPAQWDKLEALGAKLDLKDEALTPVRNAFGFRKLVRTDAEGRYEFLQTPAMGQTYGLVFFARDRLPIVQRLYDTKPDALHEATLADVPLVPAARVTIKIEFRREADNGPVSSAPSVMPRWEFDPTAKQPAWFGVMKQIDGGRRQWACDHWLPIRTTSIIYVPAETSLRLRLDVPYDDRWSPKEPDVVLKLGQGETKDIGVCTFEPSLKMTVRVVNEAGRPVEGAPIRRLDIGQNSWSVVHNTDEKGEAIFFVRPRSAGQFGIIDLPGMNQGNLPANLRLDYRVGETLENDDPAIMRMTADQIRKLRGDKPAGDV